jgi:hypothetical protein
MLARILLATGLVLSAFIATGCSTTHPCHPAQSGYQPCCAQPQQPCCEPCAAGAPANVYSTPPCSTCAPR